MLVCRHTLHVLCFYAQTLLSTCVKFMWHSDVYVVHSDFLTWLQCNSSLGLQEVSNFTQIEPV